MLVFILSLVVILTLTMFFRYSSFNLEYYFTELLDTSFIHDWYPFFLIGLIILFYFINLCLYLYYYKNKVVLSLINFIHSIDSLNSNLDNYFSLRVVFYVCITIIFLLIIIIFGSIIYEIFYLYLINPDFFWHLYIYVKFSTLYVYNLTSIIIVYYSNYEVFFLFLLFIYSIIVVLVYLFQLILYLLKFILYLVVKILTFKFCNKKNNVRNFNFKN